MKSLHMFGRRWTSHLERTMEHSALTTDVQRGQVTESLECRKDHKRCKSLSNEAFAV